MSLDIFGNPILPGDAPGQPARTPKEKANGYPAPPGSGPAGEKCKTCRHIRRNQMSKVYIKCAVIEYRWTGGAGTDIRANSPACRYWQAPGVEVGQ